MDELITQLLLPSPIQSFRFEQYPNREILIKRDDLIHPQVSGNKWRKLKYNIKYAQDNDFKGILSFGGAFSNHLYALAAACKLEGLKCKAMVRGDGFDKSNPTLIFLRNQGVEIKFLDRLSYRKKSDDDFLEKLQRQYPNYHIVPEGGSNHLAIQGVTELMEEIYANRYLGRLLVICGVGSGSTITGVVKGLKDGDQAMGVLAVNDTSLLSKIKGALTQAECRQLQLDLDSHFGGFGKTNDSLIKFINDFYYSTKIPVEPLYTGKVLYRLHALLGERELTSFDNILVLHTGGLQGNRGFNYRFPGKLAREMVDIC